jgi:predicted phage tail protein
MSIDSGTGLIQWTPTTSQVGTHAVVARVADGHGGSATQSFSIAVAAPNSPPSIANPGNQTSDVGAPVTLAIIASDADGDSLVYSASGLPAGLGIDASTGVISGVPTTLGLRSVTVTVSDGVAQASTQFSWNIGDTTAPSTPPRPDATDVRGGPILSWSPSTDNVGVSGYYVYRSTNRNSNGTRVADTSATSWQDTTAQRGVTYYYRLQAYDAAGNLSDFGPSRRIVPKK